MSLGKAGDSFNDVISQLLADLTCSSPDGQQKKGRKM
jgi:hypothetical protein